jgi:ATP/maltotriose-dependent transcriptional regulator MalT
MVLSSAVHESLSAVHPERLLDRIIGMDVWLTEREMGVLRLLRGSLTLPEIAAELELSPETIKTHTRMIYRKLGVHNRRDAVSRGQEIGILPSRTAKRHEVTWD